MNPLVSVIIPAYNAEKFIAETIQSVLDQTWPAVEIIVVDDGSTDRTADIITGKFSGKNIRYFRQVNSGSPIAKNFGLMQATGEYIQFLDADDILGADKIEQQVKALQNHPDKVAVCRTRHFKQSAAIASLTESDEIDTDFLYTTGNALEFLLNLYGIRGTRGMVQPNAYLASRTLIEKAGHWSAELNRSPDDDSEFFCRVLLSSEGVVYTPDCVNYYRKLPAELSLSKHRSLESTSGALKTIRLKAKHLLEKDSSFAVKQLIAIHYAGFIYENFTAYPLLAKKAEKNIRDLGFDRIPRSGGKNFRLLSYLIGMKGSLVLKKMVSRQYKSLRSYKAAAYQATNRML